MKELPVVNLREGLSLTEMIRIARAIKPQSWLKYGRYDEEIPFEVKIAGDFYGHGKHDYWFSYDYCGRDNDFEIYVSNNSGGSLLWNYHAIRVMQRGVSLGFSGRLRESKADNLRDFVLYVDRCAQENMLNSKKLEAQKIKEAVERVRGKFFGEGI